jgi:pimeloyl-ACP methyl ester carboxylesterase
MSLDIVFVHGMFMNPKSWGDWSKFFTAKGHRCHAPAWPFHEGEPSALRASVPEGLGKLTLGEVVDALGKHVGGLGSKPVVVGHSMGGLITQRLVAQGRARAGVCIDSAPPKGVFTLSLSFLKSNLPVVNPLAGDAPYVMPPEHFHYTFCNTMTPDQSRAVYDAYAVPESRNVARGPTTDDGAIDFAKPHAPLLFIAGERDNIVPAALNRKNHAAYTDAGSRHDFKEFPGRTHWICGQEGWEEVATFVAEWIASATSTSKSS